jgi:multidrug efflux system outer membrane protein
MRKPLTLLTASLLGACSLMPAYQRPAAPVAAQWPTSAAFAPASPAAHGVAAPDLPWSDFVGDAHLRQLIDLALTNNRDLRAATLNIEQTRAAYNLRQADQFPSLNLAANGLRQPNPNGSGHISSTYTSGLSIPAWELDLFGRVASLKEAALAQFAASQEARKAVHLSLVAAVANTWLSLQANDQLLDLAQRTMQTRDASLRLMQLRFDKGASSALDLAQTQALVASARASLAQQQRLRAFDVNALTLLVGHAIDEPLLHPASGLPSLRDVPAGAPSDWLNYRPDIMQAEAQLMAANANIGAARAAFFPRIALTASAGSGSNDLSRLFHNGTWGWTLAPSALLPIFDAGRNQANLGAAQAGRDIALAQYEKTIQVAFREVADALAGQGTLNEQVVALNAQTQAESERFRLAQLRFQNGVSSSLELLDAQRSLFATQQQLAQARLAEQQNKVTLYKALGGGWSTTPP